MSQDEAPKEDIPAWFMTYSDVITLLMTFFILLLTFSTTEPEKFERVNQNTMGADSATGVVGTIHEHMDHDSWTKRVRPRAARIAMHGSEMPPITRDPSIFSKGDGLKAPTEDEQKRDVMRSYKLLVDKNKISLDGITLTDWSGELATKLSTQLRALPLNCNLAFSSDSSSAAALRFVEHLIRDRGVRPGQLGVGFSDSVSTDRIEIVLERYEITDERQKEKTSFFRAQQGLSSFLR